MLSFMEGTFEEDSTHEEDRDFDFMGFKGFNRISQDFVLTKVVCNVMDYNRVKFEVKWIILKF